MRSSVLWTALLSRTFTSSSFSKEKGNCDPHDHYRQDPNPQIVSELKVESSKTMEYIRNLKPGLYQEMFQAISQAAVENDTAINNECSSGPTGRYLYKWAMAKPHDHSRTYQRYAVDDPSKSPQSIPDLDLLVSDLLDMSLSVDESMLAYAVRDRSNGEFQIWIDSYDCDRSIRESSIATADLAE